jgi:hypothetical protein
MARGRWQGGEFDTGHRENGTLATINWFGKTFISATDAKTADLPGRRRQ